MERRHQNLNCTSSSLSNLSEKEQVCAGGLSGLELKHWRWPNSPLMQCMERNEKRFLYYYYMWPASLCIPLLSPRVWLWKSSKLPRSYLCTDWVPGSPGRRDEPFFLFVKADSMTVHSPSHFGLGTLVGCRLCNRKHEGKVFCSCTFQALGLLVNAPESQGGDTQLWNMEVWAACLLISPWVWSLKKGKFIPERERAPHLLSKILLEDDLPMAPPL